jgi:hypothetical protein
MLSSANFPLPEYLFQTYVRVLLRWLMPVNPSYSGGRDQEDCGSKEALCDFISKIPNPLKKG